MAGHKIFKIPIEIRFRDIDAMNHVNNSVYFSYFEHGRLKFFYSIFDEYGSIIPTILAHIRCDFIRPVLITDHLLLCMWVGKLGNKSFNLGYRLENQSDESIVYAKAESVQVCYDYEKNVTTTLTDAFKEKLFIYYHET